MPYNAVVGYECFRSPCHLHLQGHFILKMEAARTLEMLVTYHNTTWHCNPEDLDMDVWMLLPHNRHFMTPINKYMYMKQYIIYN
jgi:hypothetical protein